MKHFGPPGRTAYIGDENEEVWQKYHSLAPIGNKGLSNSGDKAQRIGDQARQV
jgi:hypothetical protein